MWALVFLAFAGACQAGRTWIIPGEFATIEAGLNAAAAGDTVEIACGMYFENDLGLKSDVVVRSKYGDPGCVIVDGQFYGSVFTCALVNDGAVLEGLTIMGGNATFGGGGLHCYYSAPRISNCIFLGNSVIRDDGGAMALLHSTPTITGCTFVGNAASWGGGAVSCNQTDATFTDCLFIANVAEAGGAIGCSGVSHLIFERCTFNSNSAQYGAGLACYGSTCELINCTLSANSASISGAGIYGWESVVTLSNCILSFGTGAAIVCDGSSGPGPTQLNCCNIFGNSTGDWIGCISSQLGLNGNFSSDPVYCEPDMGDFSIADGSTCLPQNNACGVLVGAHAQGCELISIIQPLTPLPSQLFQNVPNPFNPQTAIPFSLPEAQHARLSIFDTAGRLIAEPVDRVLSSGFHTVTWRGMDRAGRPVPAGTYLVKLETTDGLQTRKITLVR